MLIALCSKYGQFQRRRLTSRANGHRNFGVLVETGGVREVTVIMKDAAAEADRFGPRGASESGPEE
jgi:hypothetical protein